MIFNSSKIAPTKKNTVSVSRKFVYSRRIKNIEKYAFTIRQYGFHFKKYLKILKKYGVLQWEYGSSLKFDLPQISIIFSISSKKLGMKKYCFQQANNSISLAGMKDWLKNMFQLKEKLLPLEAVDCCLRKWKKMVSTSQKISFHQLKYALPFKIGFHQFQ